MRFRAPCLTSNFLAESNLARTAAVVACPSLLRPACSAMGSCFSYLTREEARPEQPSEPPRHLWVARDGVSFHAHEDCEYIRRNRADEIWRRSRPDGSTGFFLLYFALVVFCFLARSGARCASRKATGSRTEEGGRPLCSRFFRGAGGLLFFNASEWSRALVGGVVSDTKPTSEARKVPTLYSQPVSAVLA